MTTLFNFFKKLFQFGSDDGVPASLMEKARASALMSENISSSTNATFEELTKFYHDEEELEQLRLEQMIQEQGHNQVLFQQQIEEDVHRQQHLQALQHMQDMHDPYKNPGQDIVVDEHYHHIDHGFD